ncbi:MAG TPA: PQQ-dependent sugar dehydrogenase, partial [Vicinamibacterales bacterium]|nr:PQQ-dependent sugar dehydrogenase [Vicinamibacterales bacterium]
MHKIIAFVACAVLVLVPAPPSAQEPVDRSARLAWDQEAASAAQAESYVYTLYADQGGMPLWGVSCSSAASRRTHECIAPLPYLRPGTHTVALSAAVIIGGSLVESMRSAPILVTIRETEIGIEPASASRRRAGVAASNVVTLDGVALTVGRVASGLSYPTDMSVAPDGVIYVAERGGTVRMVANGTLQTILALTLADVAASPSGALLGIALDPQFAANALAYLVYAASSPDARLTYRLVRFRFAGGTFAERAVLVDDVPAGPGRLAASVRFGPDGMLYVAFGDTADARRDDLGSFNGKVLRLNADGTTPRDQPAASPVYASGLTAPRGLAWNRGDGDFLILDVVDAVTTELRVVDGTGRGVSAARVVPFEANATSMVRYDHPAMPSLEGDVLIA